MSNPQGGLKLKDVEQLGLMAAITSLSYVFWVVGGMEMIERLAYYGVKAVAALYAAVEWVCPTLFNLALGHALWEVPPVSAVAALTGGCAQDIASPPGEAVGPDAVRIGAFRTTMPAWNTTLDDFAGQPGWPGAQAVYGAFGTIEDVLQHGEDVDIPYVRMKIK